jgi:hypothetical protein
MGPLQSKKNAVTRAMDGLRVFQPFPHHHCKITTPGKKWACLPRITPRHTLLASCARLRTLNGRKMRASALLTCLDVTFNLLDNGVS